MAAVGLRVPLVVAMKPYDLALRILGIVERYERRPGDVALVWQVEAAIADVVSDAERYRWWRENFGAEHDGPEMLKLYTLINSRFRRGLSEPQGFDAAIDAAMAATNG